MTRKCKTCQHVKRAEIDRRLAGGEPGSQIAAGYDINPSSLHRHRVNCLNLGSSSAIMKETSRSTAALACLPSREELGGSYVELRDRIDQIAVQAEQQGSLKVALAGLNSVRHTIDSLARLSGFDRSGTQVNVAVAAKIDVDLASLTNKIIEAFDDQPEVKARIARTLLEGGDDVD
jgi:transposase-like protein